MKTLKLKKIIPLLVGCSGLVLAASITTPLVLNHTLKTTNHYLVNKDSFYTPISSLKNVVYSNGIAFLINNNNMTASVLGYQNTLNLDTNSHDDSISANSDISQNPKNLSIPATIQNNNQLYMVDSIGVGAFFNQGLTQLNLPSTINYIGADAFANNKLTTINLPSNLKELGNNAFSNNYFDYGTKIYLPPQCHWNKNGDLAPFNNTENLGQFALGVKSIIQNSAVYDFSSISNVWRIVSYMPSVADGAKSNVTYDPNAMHYTEIHDKLTKPSHTSFTYYPVDVAMNSSLKTSRIIFKTKNKWFAGSISFQDQKLILSNVKNQNINFSIYSPNSNQTIFNSQTDAQSVVEIHDGDILNFGVSKVIPRVITNVPESETIEKSNFDQFTPYYQIDNSVPWQNGLTTSFMVTEKGLIPYQNVTHIKNNILVDNADQDYTVSGSTLANHKVKVQVGNQEPQIVQSDNNGLFKFIVKKDTTLNTIVKINVDGCNETYVKLVGSNPLKSAFLFKIGKNEFGISPNGYAKKFEIWNKSNDSMPDYNNSSLLVTNKGFDPNKPFNFPNLKANIITFENDAIVNGQHVVSKSVIELNKIKTYQDLQTALNTLNYYPNTQNTLKILIPQRSNYLFSTVSNDVVVSKENKAIIDDVSMQHFDEYIYNIDSNEIKNAIGSSSTSALGLPRDWIAGNYMLTTTGTDSKLITKDLSSNWYDPTPLMWQTVRDITANLQTDYQKATALSEWVSQNMTYTKKFTYNKTISQTFNHLEGVCGNYSTLLAVMCQMAGLVSRVVNGEALSNANYFSNYWEIDHGWTQVWDQQLGQWITLDPTWNWYKPYGQLQSKLNITRSDEHVILVLWPRHTNYFSYFAGHEEQALNLLGMYFGVKQGQDSTQYPVQYAINFAQLLNKASAYSDYEYGRISNH